MYCFQKCWFNTVQLLVGVLNFYSSFFHSLLYLKELINLLPDVKDNLINKDLSQNRAPITDENHSIVVLPPVPERKLKPV